MFSYWWLRTGLQSLISVVIHYFGAGRFTQRNQTTVRPPAFSPSPIKTLSSCHMMEGWTVNQSNGFQTASHDQQLTGGAKMIYCVICMK